MLLLSQSLCLQRIKTELRWEFPQQPTLQIIQPTSICSLAFITAILRYICSYKRPTSSFSTIWPLLLCFVSSPFSLALPISPSLLSHPIQIEIQFSKNIPLIPSSSPILSKTFWDICPYMLSAFSLLGLILFSLSQLGFCFHPLTEMLSSHCIHWSLFSFWLPWTLSRARHTRTLHST